VPLPFQRALAITLDSYDGKTPHQEIVNSKEIYRKRRERLITALGKLSPEVFHSEATFYVWFKVGDDELDFIAKAIESGILLTPGSGFGESGRGWVRASVTASNEVIDHAVEALKTL